MAGSSLRSTIDADVHVELFAAAKDFARKDIDVEVGLYKCGRVNGCRLIGVDERTYKNADRWKKMKFHFHDTDETFSPGQWVEVRVAVLDSSDADAWFAFGTADYDSRIKISDDDD